ncbi:hypothetical protein GYA19_04170 [Candidatus Beckwithbacteria bacterium]|nr:hypothetical protein [Candidatus Beckwithbacteria bacterium]
MKYFFNGNFSAINKLEFKTSQEEDLQTICKFLKENYLNYKNIKFYIFDNLEKKQSRDPNHSISKASARFEPFAIYRFWNPLDNDKKISDSHFPHELIHLIAHKFTKPYTWEVQLDIVTGGKIIKKLEMQSTSFMQEGLAIAVEDIVFGLKLREHEEEKTIDEWCKNQQYANNILEQSINFDGFCNFDNDYIVPFTASFSKFLILNFGIEKYKTMYVSIREDKTPKDNIKIIEDIFHFSQSELINQWSNNL